MFIEFAKWLIFVRCLLDALGQLVMLVSPAFLKLAQKNGWTNYSRFAAATVLVVSTAMTYIAASSLGKLLPSDFLVLVVIVGFGWSVVMLAMNRRTLIVLFDVAFWLGTSAVSAVLLFMH